MRQAEEEKKRDAANKINAAKVNPGGDNNPPTPGSTPVPNDLEEQQKTVDPKNSDKKTPNPPVKSPAGQPPVKPNPSQSGTKDNSAQVPTVPGNKGNRPNSTNRDPSENPFNRDNSQTRNQPAGDAGDNSNTPRQRAPEQEAGTQTSGVRNLPRTAAAPAAAIRSRANDGTFIDPNAKATTSSAMSMDIATPGQTKGSRQSTRVAGSDRDSGGGFNRPTSGTFKGQGGGRGSGENTSGQSRSLRIGTDSAGGDSGSSGGGRGRGKNSGGGGGPRYARGDGDPFGNPNGNKNGSKNGSPNGGGGNSDGPGGPGNGGKYAGLPGGSGRGGHGSGDGDGPGEFNRNGSSGRKPSGNGIGSGNGKGDGKGKGNGRGDDGEIAGNGGTGKTDARASTGTKAGKKYEGGDIIGRGVWGEWKVEFYQDKSDHPDTTDATFAPEHPIDWPVFTDLKATKKYKKLDFNWGVEPPAAGMKNTFWSARITGKIFVPKDDDYWFYFDQLDDAGLLVLDGNEVIKVWKVQKSTPDSGKIHLTTGEHDIRIEYVQGPATEASLTLSWKSSSFEKEVVGDYQPPEG